MASSVPREAPRARRVVFLAFPDLQALDLFGPAEVFSMASRIRPPGYAVEVVAAGDGPLTTSSGFDLLPHAPLRRPRTPIDTLMAVGGVGVQRAEQDPALVEWLRAAAARSRRLASVCNGAFLVARAGLLDGRRATTHWADCAELQRRFPEVRVEADPIFVRDGDVYSSAGVTAGMDLALALVEDDLGRRTALQVARALVLFLKRPGGQSQFSVPLAGQLSERDTLQELQAWIAGNLQEDLSVPSLAARACMSPRNFARAFRREVGMTPAVYVEAVRVERARIALEESNLAVKAVARDCGFGTVESMRRAFRRRLGVAPADYRTRFRPALEQIEAA